MEPVKLLTVNTYIEIKEMVCHKLIGENVANLCVCVG